jgi:hypothetical protein
VINAASAVMVLVFMTFALAGPLPPKEMGFILAVAVLLDATLVRLVATGRPAPSGPARLVDAEAARSPAASGRALSPPTRFRDSLTSPPCHHGTHANRVALS